MSVSVSGAVPWGAKVGRVRQKCNFSSLSVNIAWKESSERKLPAFIITRTHWGLHAEKKITPKFWLFTPEKREKVRFLALMRFYRWNGETDGNQIYIILKNFLWAFRKCLKNFFRPKIFCTIGHLTIFFHANSCLGAPNPQKMGV